MVTITLLHHHVISVVNGEVCLVWNEDGAPYQRSLKEISVSDAPKDKQTLDYFK